MLADAPEPLGRAARAGVPARSGVPAAGAPGGGVEGPFVVNGKIYINSTRVIERAAAEPGPYHNFPGSFDAVILGDGDQARSPGFFKRAKTGYSSDGIQYSLPGTRQQ